MKITTRQVIEGRELYVVDGAFSKAGIAAIDSRMRRGPYTRTRASRADTREYKFFAMTLPTSEFMETFVGEAVRDAIRMCFPGERFVTNNFVTNMRFFGNSAFPHYDFAPPQKHITVLLYANAKWNFDWGGETLFYDDEGECVMGVVPRPGRMAIFRGAITHRAGLVNRECYEPRFTLALTFKSIPKETDPAPSSRSRAKPKTSARRAPALMMG